MEHANTGHDPLDIYGKELEFTEILDELAALGKLLFTLAATDEEPVVSTAILNHFGRVAFECRNCLSRLFPDADATRTP